MAVIPISWLVIHGLVFLRQMLEDYWGPAKRLLGDMKFLERLKKYDRDNVPPKIIDVIRKKFVTDPEFTPDSVARASRYGTRANTITMLHRCSTCRPHCVTVTKPPCDFGRLKLLLILPPSLTLMCPLKSQCRGGHLQVGGGH